LVLSGFATTQTLYHVPVASEPVSKPFIPETDISMVRLTPVINSASLARLNKARQSDVASNLVLGEPEFTASLVFKL
jgi:hypothetical protein